MNILYIAGEYTPTEIAVTIRSSFNVAALRSKGHCVVVLTTGDDRTGRWGEIVHGVYSASQENSPDMLRRLIHELRLGFSFGRYLIRKGRHFDRVIVTSPPFFTLVVIWLHLRILRAVYIVDIRDHYPCVLFSLGVLRPQSLAGRALSWIESRIYKYSAAVVTVTQKIVDDVSKAVPGVSVHLVRNGYDADLFVPKNGGADRTALFTIVQHGLFGKSTDIETIERIVLYCHEHAGPHRFLFIGYGPKLDALKSRKLPNVTILGAVSQERIAEHLSASDLGMSVHLPTEHILAAFPVKVFEYIGAGLPALVLPRGLAGAEISSRGMGSAFQNDDWAAAAQWLVDLIASEALYGEYRRAVQSGRLIYSRQEQSARFADIVSNT